jgi:hypothetical protein
LFLTSSLYFQSAAVPGRRISISPPAQSPARWQQYIDIMKVRPELTFIFFLCSCVYDPPQKGKEIFIHNQTDKPIIIVDSLTGNQLRLYDTANVNNRRYIIRQSKYMTEYGNYQKFYSDVEMNNFKLKNNNKITFYIIDTSDLQNILRQFSIDNSLRSFDVNIDTLKKYDLNHLFITSDTILFEHDYNYYTNWKR